MQGAAPLAQGFTSNYTTVLAMQGPAALAIGHHYKAPHTALKVTIRPHKQPLKVKQNYTKVPL